MAWSADDSKMVSCGVDGAVYEWNMKDFKRAGEHVRVTLLYPMFFFDILRRCSRPATTVP